MWQGHIFLAIYIKYGFKFISSFITVFVETLDRYWILVTGYYINWYNLLIK